ncbi:MAG TPA: NAD(P)H-dependent oxidoreductase [Pseudonocardiaceae bacterium]|jgi:FMN-dependent NADH-azoreductase|nr:NAD(P)H-dependent oxidoreductase [Pseudonocardiaceae bacterium]
MATLLHIDSSIRHEGSTSREVTAAFTDHWQKANPDGTVIYRDLAVNPVPHLNAAGYYAAQTPAEDRTPEQRVAVATHQELVDELLSADAIVLGVPMYNFSVPDSFKSWLDHIIVPGIVPNPETGHSPLAGKRVIVVHARGGAYGPGTPRADFDFQEKYLRKVFGFLGADTAVTFVAAEMTLADVVPALAKFKDFKQESLANAHSAVRELASTSVA